MALFRASVPRLPCILGQFPAPVGHYGTFSGLSAPLTLHSWTISFPGGALWHFFDSSVPRLPCILGHFPAPAGHYHAFLTLQCPAYLAPKSNSLPQRGTMDTFQPSVPRQHAPPSLPTKKWRTLNPPFTYSITNILVVLIISPFSSS